MINNLSSQLPVPNYEIQEEPSSTSAASASSPSSSASDKESTTATGAAAGRSNTMPNRMHADRNKCMQACFNRSHSISGPEVSNIDLSPLLTHSSNSIERPVSGTYKWPSLVCTFVIDKGTGTLGWAGPEVDTQRRRKNDAVALGSLFEELNKSPVFTARMKTLAQQSPENPQFEIKYKMGEQMDKTYNTLRSRFVIKQAAVWKNADLASQHRASAAASGTPISAAEDDYSELDFSDDGNRRGLSLLSAALRGIEKHGSRWDEKTGSDDYASLAEVMPKLTIRVPRDKNAGADNVSATETAQTASAIQDAVLEEMQGASHLHFRAKQANNHARYQAGKIEYNLGALAFSMLGGAGYSLGMMVINNSINRGMLPAAVQKEKGLDKQSNIQKAFTDVTEDLLPVATSWEKFLMTFNPSWQIGSWEIFDNVILDAVLGGDDDDESDTASADASVHSQASTSSEGSEVTPAAPQRSWGEAILGAPGRAYAAINQLEPQKAWDGVKSVAGQMITSAPFAVPAGIISGVFSWPDKAIEIWKPGATGSVFKAGFKMAATSPISSLACSSGFFLKMGEVAAETEAAVLQALMDGKLAWPESNPFNSAQAFDRSDLEQIKRAVWDMTQDQLNNEPDSLAVRLSVPMEFLSGVLQGGISLIPGMTQAISFALDTVFFGPGELLWMTLTGIASNYANEQELRTKLAEVQQQCEARNASPAETRIAAVQFLLDNQLISEEALRQWHEQTTSMLGGAMIHQVYEKSADLKNVGRAGLRNVLVDMPSWVGGKIAAVMPEQMHQIGAQTGKVAETVGNYLEQGVDFAAGRYAETLKRLSKNTVNSISSVFTPGENNMRVRARLPYEKALQPRIEELEV